MADNTGKDRSIRVFNHGFQGVHGGHQIHSLNLYNSYFSAHFVQSTKHLNNNLSCFPSLLIVEKKTKDHYQ